MLRTIEIRKEYLASSAWQQLLKDCGLYYVTAKHDDCNTLCLQVHDKSIKFNHDTFRNTKEELTVNHA